LARLAKGVHRNPSKLELEELSLSREHGLVSSARPLLALELTVFGRCSTSTFFREISNAFKRLSMPA
jgi:hypothetical protein